ncbi:MAG: O-antigen ligase family protein [Bdellovibrionota bacterium]
MTESVHKGVSPSLELEKLIIDKKVSKWESVLLHLVVFALLLPSAWQSISAGLLGLTFLFQKGYRSNVWSSEVGMLFRKTLTFLALAWICLILLGILDDMRGGEFKPYIRLLGKQGLWGAVTMAAIIYFQFTRTKNFLNLKVLLGFTSLLLIYCVVQRYTGIDWVHGFSGKLGMNRYAYDVYRVSGWMDHPLTFAFNLMLVALISVAECFYVFKRGFQKEAYLWAAQAGLLLTLLLLTDSRFPIALTFALILCAAIWEFPKFRIPAISFLFVLLIAGALTLPNLSPEKIGRWGELVNSNQPLEQRFDRLIFWKINWQLFEESPWTGTGLKAYDGRLLDTYLSAGYTNLERKYNAHNIYLQTLADTGALGGLGLSFLLIGLGRLAFRVKRRFEHIALPLIVMATLFSGLVQNNLRDTEYLFALWISVGLSLSWLIVQGKPDDRGSERQLEDLKP